MIIQRIGNKLGYIIISLILLMAQMTPLFVFAPQASADGNGSPVGCDTSENVVGSIGGEDNSESGDLVEYNVGTGYIVDGVCIKSGTNMFNDNQHSGVLDNGTYEDGCYVVTGVGTQSVKVERIGSGSDCQEISHIDVVKLAVGSISGYKWNDENGDGNVTGENKLSGWTIELYKDNQLFKTTVTDIDGNYKFENLALGEYKICEVQQNGWEQTFPTTADGCKSTTLTESDPSKTGKPFSFGNKEAVTPVVALQLTSECRNTDAPSATWFIRNENPFPVNFNWKFAGGGATGSETVPAAGSGETLPWAPERGANYLFFDTPQIGTLIVTWIDENQVVKQTTKATNTKECPKPDPQDDPYVRITYICKADFNGVALAWNGSENEPVNVNKGDHIWRFRYESAKSEVNAPAMVDYSTNFLGMTGDLDLDEIEFKTTADGANGVNVSTVPGPNLYKGTASVSGAMCEEQDLRGAVVVTKFNDEDKDGVWDEDEEKLENWDIQLTGQQYCDNGYTNGAVSAYSLVNIIVTVPKLCGDATRMYEETTDENGEAAFKVDRGLYKVSETLKEGWEQTGIYCDPIERLEINRSMVVENGYEMPTDLVKVYTNETRYCYVGNYQTPEEPEQPEETEEPGQVLGTTTTVTPQPQVLASTGSGSTFAAMLASLLLIGATAGLSRTVVHKQ